MQQIEFRAMNCQMLAVVDADSSKAAAALAQTPGWFEQWEQCFSRFRSDSELNQLNASQLQWRTASLNLCSAIDAARWAAAFSNGLVSPLLLNALERAGYNRSFEQLAQHQQDSSLLATPAFYRVPDWRALEVDKVRQQVFIPTGTRLDLGGIVKGWAAEQAAQRLGEFGASLVDAGGDIAVSGSRTNGEPWPIGIANPSSPDADLAATDLEVLLIYTGAVATSGREYRRWQRNSIWHHHILDPRTGRSAQTDVISATVVAPRMLMAETAAKAALILGSRSGMTWIEAHSELAALLVVEGGQTLRSQRLDEYLCK